MMERLEELAARTEAILRSHGYRVARIEYPVEHDKRSIDLVAVRGEKPLLVKVAEDAASVATGDVRELQGCSRVLHGAGLVVAERDAGEEIDDIVAHERMGVYVVSPQGLEAALHGSIYVVKRQKSFYMRVDGRRLREARLEKGYSLGDVASMLSVSRRSVYLYEQEESLVSLPVALKLMEIFGEDIFKPFDVIEEQGGEPPRSPRGKIGESLSRAGLAVVETKRIPPNAVASGTRSKIVVIIERRRERDIERRVEEAERVASSIKAYVIAVGSDKIKSIARGHDVYYVSSAEEAARLARQLDTGSEEESQA